MAQLFDDFQGGTTYAVRFRAKADAPRSIQLAAEVEEPDWHSIGLREAVLLTEDWQTYQYEFQAKDIAALNRIVFWLGDCTGTVWIADFTRTKVAK